MEACEEKRTQYRQRIEAITLQSLVYIDESGIDMSICKDRGWGNETIWQKEW